MPQVNNDIRKVLETHETNYTRQPDKTWKWSCKCGEEEALPDRDSCLSATKDHLTSELQIEFNKVEAEDMAPEQQETDEPVDLSILSYLLGQVDKERIGFPEARRRLGLWWHSKPRNAEFVAAARTRVIRFNQMADGLTEEIQSLFASSIQ